MTTPELTEREAAQLRDAFAATKNCLDAAEENSFGLAGLLREQMAAHEFSQRQMAKAAKARDIGLSQAHVSRLCGWRELVESLVKSELIPAGITPPEFGLRPLVVARNKGLTDEQVTEVWELHQAEPKKSYKAWLREIHPALYPPKTPTLKKLRAEAAAFIEANGYEAFQDFYIKVNADHNPANTTMRIA